MTQNYSKALDNPIFKIILEVSDTLGYKSYVIGGFVRDFFLKTPSLDIDILCIGDGIKLAEAVAKKLSNKPKVTVFKNFGTAMLKHQNLQIEFVGARKESYHFNSRKPTVEKGTLEDDQNRRDFTINTMAFGLNKDNFGTLYDPFKGIVDLKNKVIKTPLEPHKTYSDDPLRMLRCIRFATKLDFKIEPDSFSSIKENSARLKIISSERILEELNKIILSTRPSKGFLLLEKSKLLELILPELIALKGVEEVDGQRHKDNFYHSLEVLDNICPHTDKLWLRWAALLHDIGKATTKRFDSKIGWTFHNHEFVGSKMVIKIFRRLKMPLGEPMKFVQKIILLSSRPIVLSEDSATDSAVRRLIFEAGDDIEELITLCEADITTKNKVKFERYHNNFRLVRKKISEVEERDRIRNFQSPISGELIMKTFNIKPSKTIGIIKDHIKEAILEGEITNDYQKAYEFMIKKAHEIGLKTSTNNYETNK